jgi:gluconate 2-dehydrogenase alpha chain
MAQRLKEVNVAVIGVGTVGTMVSKESAAAGYKVVGLERGQTRATVREFQSPGIHDELRFDVRKALMQDNTREQVFVSQPSRYLKHVAYRASAARDLNPLQR